MHMLHLFCFSKQYFTKLEIIYHKVENTLPSFRSVHKNIAIKISVNLPGFLHTSLTFLQGYKLLWAPMEKSCS